MDCVFCKIASKEITSRVIFETENSLAFLDAFPLSIGHTLVIPKSHYKKIQDMSSEINTDLFLAVQKVTKKIDMITGSTLLAIHNGEDSGQEIPHVHVHLIPRSKDDNAGPVHRMFNEPPKISDSELDQLCKKLKIS